MGLTRNTQSHMDMVLSIFTEIWSHTGALSRISGYVTHSIQRSFIHALEIPYWHVNTMCSHLRAKQSRKSHKIYAAFLRMELQYAVKVQRSLAPLSRFPGSHIPTAHEQECCRFQSYANSVRSPMKFTSEIDIAWTTFLGSTTTDHVITSCDVGL